MTGGKKHTVKILVILSLGILILFSCRNPLLTEIEGEVQFVVTPPEVESVFPANGATNVAITTNTISIEFSKSIDASTVSSSTITIEDSSETKLSGSWSVSGATLTFTPNSNLAYSETYTVTVTSAVLDTNAKSLTEAYSWSFTTGIAPDTVAPEITAVTLNNGDAWSNSLTVTVEIDASDNYDTEDATSIAQMKINDGEWESYSPTTSYTLSPGEGLRTVRVLLKDGSGNESQAVSDSINIDTVVPVITSFLINNGASATNNETVDLDVFVTDEDSSGIDQFRYRLEGAAWSDWQTLTEEAGVGIGNVTDVSLDVSLGNTQVFEMQASDIAGNVSVESAASILFEQTPPSVVDVSWDDDSTFPYNGSVLRIAFNEEMNPASFTSSVFTLYDIDNAGDISGTISFTEDNGTPNSIAELWGLELDPNTQYRVTLVDSVEDIAGNVMGGGNKVWYFSTGDATDTEPPSGTVTLTGSVTLPSGTSAVSSATVELDFSAVTDDYNIPYGIKVWGDNDGMNAGEESFEQDASWISWPAGDTLAWHLSTASGTKYLLYKLMDSAGNESASPTQIKIILDAFVEPVISSVAIDEGAVYTNASDRAVDLTITAADAHSGVQYMMISNDSGFSGATWQSYEPTVTDWILPDSDGENFIYIKVKDYLGNVSDGDTAFSGASGIPSIILDRTPPTVTWNESSIQLSTATQLGQGAEGTDYYQVVETSGLAEYLWEKQSGSGSLYFNSTSSGGTSNDATDIDEPWVSASTEDEYFIKLTLTDNAGNIASSSIPLVWDITAPGDIANLTADYWNTDGQPVWTWDAASDADFYRTSFDSGFASYIDVTTTSFSPSSPLTPDGLRTLYVAAYDDAGNSSTVLDSAVWVDTTPPTITVNTQSYIANIATPEITIDFEDAEVDGSFTDGGTGASGILSRSWSLLSGPGNLDFGSPLYGTTTVSADINGNYQIRLTVTDNAGNQSYTDLPLLRDLNAPADPVITGMPQTPNLKPTWFWAGGGGGIGVFEYRLYNETDSSVEYGPTQTTATSFTPPSNLTNERNYRLYVTEKDGANNWSTEVSFATQVDTSLTTPPQITIGDAYPMLRTVNTMIWNLLTGSGGIATQYRYYYDGSGSWTTVTTSGLSNDSLNPTQISRTGLSDGQHSITVQEYFNGNWQDGTNGTDDLTATHTITVDTTPPSAPTVDGPGNDTGNSDRTATYDTTPTWTWTSGGGGNGSYSYRLTRTETANGTTDGTILVDWSADTTATSYTSSSLSDGTYKLEVKERDDAGNYSSTGYMKVTVDTVYPTLSTVTIRPDSTDRHPDDTDYTYTKDPTVNVDITGNISSEINSAYDRPVQINIYDYNVYTWDDYTAPWSESVPTAETVRLTLPSTNGTRKVYIRLRDEAGHITSYIYDEIILDTVAPTGTFKINNDASTTPSLSCYLTLTASDIDSYGNGSGPEDIEVRTYYGGWNDYRPYSTSLLSDFEFTPYAGGKGAYVQFRDAAGNTTSSIYDSITLEVPAPRYAMKGVYDGGRTYVYFDDVTEPTADFTTRFYTYYSTDPNADPNSGDPVTYAGYTTSTSYDYVSGLPEGELLYFWIRARDDDSGGYGPYSSTNVLGYSSDVTVIYDDTDGTDTQRALDIKALLEDDQNITGDFYVYGTMPDWTVTLLPEDEIQNTYVTAEPYTNRVYGDPIIITPRASYILYLNNNEQIRNIASTGRGVLAMGYYAASFVYRVSYNWVSWGLSGTQPADITNQMTLTSAQSAKTRASSTSEDIWYTPLYYSILYNSYRETSIAVNIFSSDTGRRGTNIPGGANPTGGAIYAGDVSSTAHFPVVRQGDYCIFSYYEVPNVTRTGEVFFINLVSRMEDF